MVLLNDMKIPNEFITANHLLMIRNEKVELTYNFALVFECEEPMGTISFPTPTNYYQEVLYQSERGKAHLETCKIREKHFFDNKRVSKLKDSDGKELPSSLVAVMHANNELDQLLASAQQVEKVQPLQFESTIEDSLPGLAGMFQTNSATLSERSISVKPQLPGANKGKTVESTSTEDSFLPGLRGFFQ